MTAGAGGTISEVTVSGVDDDAALATVESDTSTLRRITLYRYNFASGKLTQAEIVTDGSMITI